MEEAWLSQGLRPEVEIKDLHASYGGIEALKGVSIELMEGEFVALIGANGAGKSTLLNCISGIVRPSKGMIRFQGKHITGLKPHEIVRLGISQVPEGRRIFSRLTVKENLFMGAYAKGRGRHPRVELEEVYELFPRLKERERQVAGTLSGGEQQMLAIGRALMADPKVLLLDEPSMGLAPILVDAIFDTIKRINQGGKSILLVEQNAFIALESTKRSYVIQTGKITLSGSSQELLEMEEVKRVYLGMD
jgi:branched-chain amino acid transport system ATP-binding protein